MLQELVFEVPQVRVDNSVWTWLAREKLENQRLSTAAIVGKCNVKSERIGEKSRIVVYHEEGIQDSPIQVYIHNMNTAKEFKEFDRIGLLNRATPLADDLTPQLHLVSFADLKTYIFTYNVGIPSMNPTDYNFTCTSVRPIEKLVSAGKLGIIRNNIELAFTSDSVQDGDIITFPGDLFNPESNHLPFHMRTVLTSIATHIHDAITVSIQFEGHVYENVSIRPSKTSRMVPFWVRWPHPVTLKPTTIQSVDLKRFLDPATIADEAVNLNIKLIKWRLIPGIEPEKMSSRKFLLLGAGTLGCAVARCLISWGVSNITLVDSGRVSYSNPPRQWLFNLQDAVNNAPKAETAARRLREILPNANVNGIELSIPLPGHPSDLISMDETHAKLHALISSHDVILMLTDSRESRWLPSLMVAATTTSESQPLGISVALGFDSYLIKSQSVGQSNAACYFCNDVNAPSDSTAFRTLDQQCTVTRPGLAAIASCMAVELVATLAQARDGFNSSRTIEDDARISPLGAIPDQIRGFLGTFQSFPAVSEKFDHCVCCSNQVVEAYRQRGIEMVKEVVQDASKLMKISGLEEFTERIEKGQDYGHGFDLLDLQFDEHDEEEEVGA